MIDLREIDAKIAEKVMGWKPEPKAGILYGRIGSMYVPESEAVPVPGFRKPDGLCCYADGVPHYSSNPADSKKVREKLAERWPRQALVRFVEKPNHQFMLDSEPTIIGPLADTEELAVALLALKALEAKHEGS